MTIALATLTALVLSASASASESKPHADSSDAMKCDHPEAKQVPAYEASNSRGVIVRGEKIDKAADITLADLLRSPERQDGKTVVVEGKVRRACQRMGCWMELAETAKGPGVRITFKDYGFFVPVDSAGARAKVAGTVKVVELSNEVAAHYESEGGRVAKTPDGKRREVQLVATGVELRR